MWRELTSDDVLSVLNAFEQAAYGTVDGSTSGTVMADCIAQVVNDCRGFIADNMSNQLATGLLLPERVIGAACDLICVKFLTRLGIEVSKDRLSAASAARTFFYRVADGKIAIERPQDLPLEIPPPVSDFEVISKRQHQGLDRRGLDAL